MTRIAFAALAAAALAGLTCSPWQDETKGTAPADTTTESGGAGGSACSTCSGFITASSTCQPPDCPSSDTVCEGAARDALDALLDCIFCDACPSACPDQCGGCGGGSLGGLSEACEGCLIGALGSSCATAYQTCASSG